MEDPTGMIDAQAFIDRLITRLNVDPQDVIDRLPALERALGPDGTAQTAMDATLVAGKIASLTLALLEVERAGVPAEDLADLRFRLKAAALGQKIALLRTVSDDD